jgi:hypothetical protein
VEDAASVEAAVDSAASSPLDPPVAVASGRPVDPSPVVVALDRPEELLLAVDDTPIVVDLPSSTTKIPDPEGSAEYTTPDTVTASPPADGKAVPPMMYGESPVPEPEMPCSMYVANSSEPSTTTPNPEGKAEYTTPETVAAGPPAMTVMLPSST